MSRAVSRSLTPAVMFLMMGVCMLLFLLLEPSLAHAAAEPGEEAGKTITGGQDPTGTVLGDKLADMISGFTKPLLTVVGGAASFAAFGKRDSGRVVHVVMLTTVIGGFVYRPEVVQDIIDKLWQSVA